ncbi:hypothetical protein [Christiangramia crocea]|uniref:Uncharacterized protein n=1 Tax=Christiangramia crocea TaxID=2904124 RepID=A0A9X2A9D7_9FLAO|nr:hypothetical protein [Gramella crocea]MCG9972768.1 hypothetical protein [Gramella crocea]
MKREIREKLLLADLPEQTEGDYINLKIPEHLEPRCLGYANMFADLEICSNALDKLEKSEDEIITNALFTTIIISYGRCFTDSSSSKTPKLEDKIFKNNPDLENLHKDLMEMRHNFIAHRGFSDHSVGKAFLQISPSKMQGSIKVGHLFTNNFSVEELPRYKALFDFTMLEIRKKFSKAEKHIVQEIFKDLKPGDLKRLVITDYPQ